MKNNIIRCSICVVLSMIFFSQTIVFGTRIEEVNLDDSVDKVIQLSSLEYETLSEWELNRRKIIDKLAFFLGKAPSYKVDLNSKLFSKKDMGTYTRSKISYNVDINETVTAYLLIPKNIKNPTPAVLALHQTTKHGKDEVVGLTNNREMSYGIDLVEQGFIVLVPDALTAGDRIYKGYAEYQTKAFYDENSNWSIIGKAIWDNQKAVDYLMTLEIVDKKNIMAMGHSEGAIDSIFLAAFDERISSIAINCGLSTIEGDPNPLRWSRDSWFVAFPKLREYLVRGEIPFDFHEIIALIAPRPILSFSASNDIYFPHYEGVMQLGKEVSKIYELYNEKENLNIYVFNGEHSFTDLNKLIMYNWLKVNSGLK